MRRATIRDIAEATGYSKTTISFAFNNPSRISDNAKGKILAKAAELGYVPDPVARSLSRRKLDTIGLLLPHSIPFALQNPYIVRLIRGLGEVCNEHGLALTMLPPSRGDLFRSVRSAAVDGLVTIGLRPEDEIVNLINQRQMPYVTIDGDAGGEVPSIMVDDREGARLAMEHVLLAGHREIGIVMLEEGQTDNREEYSGIGRVRLDGYYDALEQAGIAANDSHVRVFSAPCSLAGGQAVAKQLCNQNPAVTAVLCMSDIIALGLYRGLALAGAAIPRDYSIVGFDDITECELVDPPLSTVHQPAEEKGRKAGELLLARIKKSSVADVLFPCRLVSRSSVRELRRTE
ncbi:MAG: LacI family DNA-binding transcriptional regulator [Spirochaetales bacterium]